MRILAFSDLHRDLMHQRLKIIQTCHKVCLTVHLNHHANTPIMDIAIDQTHSCLTIALFLSPS